MFRYVCLSICRCSFGTLIMFGRHRSNELIKDLSLILFIGNFSSACLPRSAFCACSIASRRWRCRLLSNVTGGVTLFSMFTNIEPGQIMELPRWCLLDDGVGVLQLVQ